jgi:large subunit ribosomal protein L16
MLLRPRKINYKNSHKKRSYKKLKSKLPLNSKLIYGQFGLKNLNPNFILYNKHLFKLKIFLKKSVRRSNITNRYLWVNIFPHIPVTKKVIGSRMGKGKGKLSN